jgi:hypothetical protein
MMGGVSAATVDFFVSYTSADRPWAEWIAWELELAGFRTIGQAWDILPGSNFVLEIDDAARVAKPTIAGAVAGVLGVATRLGRLGGGVRADPTGKRRKLVPVRVRECSPDGLLRSVAYVDVLGLSQTASPDALMAGVTEGRTKPATAPALPGTASRLDAHVYLVHDDRPAARLVALEHLDVAHRALPLRQRLEVRQRVEAGPRCGRDVRRLTFAVGGVCPGQLPGDREERATRCASMRA